MNPKVLYSIIGLTVLMFIGGIYMVSRPTTTTGKNYDEFAQCLTDKGFVMYGTSSCVYCQRQKADFGNSFKLIKYVDCILNPKACTEAGVESTPTWVASDSSRLIGQQPLSKLAEASSCTLPN